MPSQNSSTVPKNRGPFQEVSHQAGPFGSTNWLVALFQQAYVFVVGGGNYIEYQNLRDYCIRQQQAPKRITYGTTELMDASEFLAQVSLLSLVLETFTSILTYRMLPFHVTHSCLIWEDHQNDGKRLITMWFYGWLVTQGKQWSNWQSFDELFPVGQTENAYQQQVVLTQK